MAALEPAVTTPVLVVGESLVDIVQRADGSTDRHPGGSPANVAIGLARLGHPVRFATRIGTDADGVAVRAHLETDGVVLAAGAVLDAATSTATAVLDAAGVASYVFDLVWDLPAVDVGDAGHVHTGSIAANLAPGATRVHELLVTARAGATTSYDPNLRPRIIGTPDDERPGVEGLVALADVVKASDQDLEWLYPGEPVEQVAELWATTGPALVVVTRGAAGASAWLARHPEEVVTAAPRRVDVVDTVGAGDAFMAGLVSSLLDQGLLGGPAERSALQASTATDVGAALERATLASSITCGRPGADPPTRAEI